MTTPDWIENLVSGWNSCDVTAIISHYCEDAVITDYGAESQTYAGKDEIQNLWERISTFDSASTWIVENVFGREPEWAVEWRNLGTNKEARSWDFPGCSVFSLRGDLIEAQRDYWNMADFLGQIGASSLDLDTL